MLLRRKQMRKLCFIVKLFVIVASVGVVLTMLQVSSGGHRGSEALLQRFSRAQLNHFEDLVRADENSIVPGLGEGGDAVMLYGAERTLGLRSEKKLAMNVYLSNKIAYNRTLKDYRNPRCGLITYDAELPSVSVVIIFHNEPYSVLVRTIWSVLNSARRSNKFLKNARFKTPGSGREMALGYPGQDPADEFVYLKEIILVDDNSTLPELKGKLDYYIDTRMTGGIVKVVRLEERIGLIRARHHGAKVATGDVMVFLDSHCEVVQDWLRPMLQRIKDKRSAVLVPVIDIIATSTFHYTTQDSKSFQVGGFNFAGHFTWIDIPEEEKKRRGDDIAPTWSPTMAGGLFAIDRNYYWQIGGYDEQMNGWGGENLEMSFRVWQCGGTLETVPCSRVGHVFRSFHPYGLPGNSDTHGINTARMAEVWMDEYAELFYLHRSDLRGSPRIGDVTHRRVLREKLGCKSFQWYLDTLLRGKYVPVRDTVAYGRSENPASGLCLDTLQRDKTASNLGVYGCHKTLQGTQYMALSLLGELRTEEKCAEVRYTREESKTADRAAKEVVMADCHGKKREQLWKYLPSGQLLNVRSGLCADTRALGNGEDIVVRKCEDKKDTQMWRFDYSESNNYGVEPGQKMTEQEQRLAKIRGRRSFRRYSRSLLSFDSQDYDSNSSSAPHWIRRIREVMIKESVIQANTTENIHFHTAEAKSNSYLKVRTAALHVKIATGGQEHKPKKKKKFLKHQPKAIENKDMAVIKEKDKNTISGKYSNHKIKSIDPKVSNKKTDINSDNDLKINPKHANNSYGINKKFHKRKRNMNKRRVRRDILDNKSIRTDQKRKVKNKFVLEIRRTLPNNTEDHLEVDIMCKHRQLYPNNTFVQDLVHILNKFDIKVINNGKVFDKNGITELPKENKTWSDLENLKEKQKTEEKASDSTKQSEHSNVKSCDHANFEINRRLNSTYGHESDVECKSCNMIEKTKNVGTKSEEHKNRLDSREDHRLDNLEDRHSGNCDNNHLDNYGNHNLDNHQGQHLDNREDQVLKTLNEHLKDHHIENHDEHLQDHHIDSHDERHVDNAEKHNNEDHHMDKHRDVNSADEAIKNSYSDTNGKKVDSYRDTVHRDTEVSHKKNYTKNFSDNSKNEKVLLRGKITIQDTDTEADRKSDSDTERKSDSDSDIKPRTNKMSRSENERNSDYELRSNSDNEHSVDVKVDQEVLKNLLAPEILAKYDIESDIMTEVKKLKKGRKNHKPSAKELRKTERTKSHSKKLKKPQLEFLRNRNVERGMIEVTPSSTKKQRETTVNPDIAFLDSLTASSEGASSVSSETEDMQQRIRKLLRKPVAAATGGAGGARRGADFKQGGAGNVPARTVSSELLYPEGGLAKSAQSDSNSSTER